MLRIVVLGGPEHINHLHKKMTYDEETMDPVNSHVNQSLVCLMWPPKQLTEIEAAQSVGAFPFLLMRSNLHIIHHQRNPASEHKHTMTNHGRRVKTTR